MPLFTDLYNVVGPKSTIAQRAAGAVGLVGNRLNLPEFGISESAGIAKAPRIEQNTSSQDQSGPGGAYPIAGGSNPNTGGSGTFTNAGGLAPTTQTDTGGGTPQDTGPSTIDIINDAYNSEQDFLNQRESSVREDASSSRNLLDTQFNETKGQLNREQGLRQDELSDRNIDVRQDFQQSFGRIKTNLSELANRNAVLLAKLGSPVSSVGSALTERLGRVTAQGVGELTTQRQQALTKIQNELERTNNFFTNQVTNLQLGYQQGIQTVESELRQRLDQIAGLRNESQRAKANATLGAWQDYANKRSQLNLQLYNTRQALTQWAVNKGKSLEQAQGFALQATPEIDPSTFGVVAPTQSIAGFSNLPQSTNRAPVRFNANPDEEEDPINGILPTTVTSALS